MKRQEFLDTLQAAINGLSEAEASSIINYYNEYLDDAGITNDNDEVTGFDSPQDIAKKIMEEAEKSDKAEDVGSKSESNETTVGNQTDMGEFNRIDVDVIAATIELIYSDKNAVEYEFQKWESILCCRVDEATKTLVIKTKRAFFGIGFWGIGSIAQHNFVRIYYNNKNAFENISLKTVSGNISCQPLNLTNIYCKTVSGMITANGINANRAHMGAISGGIRLANMGDRFENKLEVETISGVIEAETITSGDTSLQTTSGRITLNNAATKRLELSTTSGSITAYGNFEGRTEAVAVSGSINITTRLPIDIYNYAVRSVSGRTTVNRNTFKGNMILGKPNSIEAHTVSGKINIDFENHL